MLFWLDAHWSGSQTYGEDDECPLLEELEIILSSNLKNFAILIDDARLFLAPPPLPHNLEIWPSITDICRAVPDNYDLIVRNDVIYIIPDHVEMRAYTQKIITSDWSNYVNSHKPVTTSTFRSVLVKVPFFSAKQSEGRTTSASFAVSVKKISCTTRNSNFLRHSSV